MFLFARTRKSKIAEMPGSLFKAMAKEQAGLTVVELLIAVTILVFVLAGAYTFFSFGWSSFDRGTDRAVVQNNLRMAAEAITKEVRFAEGISIIDASDVPDPVVDDTYLFINNDSRIEKKDSNGSSIIPHELDSNVSLELGFERSSSNVLKVVITETGSNMTLETEIRILNIPGSSIENSSGNAIRIGSNGSGGNGGQVSVEGISLDQETMNLSIGSSSTLSVIFEPVDATNQDVVWSTANANIATVDSGNVTAVVEGTTSISALSVDGGYNASCTVNVSSILHTLDISSSPVEGGEITGAGNYAQDTLVDITASANQGYEFAGWTAPVGSFNDSGSAATVFSMPGQNVTVTANFTDIATADDVAADIAFLLNTVPISVTDHLQNSYNVTLPTVGESGSSISWSISGSGNASLSGNTLLLSSPNQNGTWIAVLTALVSKNEIEQNVVFEVEIKRTNLGPGNSNPRYHYSITHQE